jgi:hypothetical protein
MVSGSTPCFIDKECYASTMWRVSAPQSVFDDFRKMLFVSQFGNGTICNNRWVALGLALLLQLVT